MLFDEQEIPLPSEAEPASSRARYFAPEQLVTCEKCLRANSPTRTACLYCAAELPQTAFSASLQRPTLRKLEEWEQGINVILLPDSAGLSREMFAAAARLLHLEPENLERIIDANSPLPLARAANSNEASLIKNQLEEMGWRLLLVADQDLMPDDSALRRVRGLELGDSNLALRPAAGEVAASLHWDQIVLLVAGRFFVRSVEVEERRGRKDEKEIVDARELMTDEAVLDIYTTRSSECWRIAAGKFDFSCLGARKGLLAAQNFSTLVEILRERADRAAYDDSYRRVRQALSSVWPLEEHTEAGGRRRRTGRVNTEAIIKSDNEAQFTRYSRLQYHLSLHRTEPGA